MGDGSGLLIDVHATRRGSSSRERRLVFAPAAASQRLGESLIGAAGRGAEAECRGVRRMKWEGWGGGFVCLGGTVGRRERERSVGRYELLICETLQR